MPKSPHDIAAMFALAVSLIVGTAMFKLARRHYTDVQRATLAARGLNEIATAAGFGSLIAYLFAPVQPLLAVSGALGCALLGAYGLFRHHAGQQYSIAARALLTVGLSIQLVGFVVAVILRAWS